MGIYILPSLCRRKIHEDSNVRDFLVPSGKLLHNYRKSPFSMGKLTISMAIFNSFLYSLPEGFTVGIGG